MPNKAEIVGAFIFPHGTITLDPETRDFSNIPAVLPTSKEECIKLHHAMKMAAEQLVATKPDIVILSTPHGLTLQDEFLVIGNSRAKGNAEWEGEWANFTADINLESPELTKGLVAHLSENGSPAELLTLGWPTDAVNLCWAEVVPWWFISKAFQNANMDQPKAILLGQPINHMLTPKIHIPTLLQLGSNFAAFLRDDTSLNGKRVAIVISSDLSHYHSKDPTSWCAPKYTENAKVFDQYIQNWAAIDYANDPVNWEQLEENLLKNGGGLADSIGSCGYTGLVFLHGFMKGYLTFGNNEKLRYKATVLHYGVPTYYGMLCSSWTLQK